MVYSYRKSAKEEVFAAKNTTAAEMLRQKASIDAVALPGGNATLFAVFAFSAWVILQELVERVSSVR